MHAQKIVIELFSPAVNKKVQVLIFLWWFSTHFHKKSTRAQQSSVHMHRQCRTFCSSHWLPGILLITVSSLEQALKADLPREGARMHLLNREPSALARSELQREQISFIQTAALAGTAAAPPRLTHLVHESSPEALTAPSLLREWGRVSYFWWRAVSPCYKIILFSGSCPGLWEPGNQFSPQLEGKQTLFRNQATLLVPEEAQALQMVQGLSL